jgi:hypothetical protein
MFVSVEAIRVNRKKLRKLSNAKIHQYVRDCERGDEFPPILVEDCGGFYTVRDGRHRYQAYLMTGFSQIEVELY